MPCRIPWREGFTRSGQRDRGVGLGPPLPTLWNRSCHVGNSPGGGGGSERRRTCPFRLFAHHHLPRMAVDGNDPGCRGRRKPGKPRAFLHPQPRRGLTPIQAPQPNPPQTRNPQDAPVTTPRPREDSSAPQPRPPASALPPRSIAKRRRGKPCGPAWGPAHGTKGQVLLVRRDTGTAWRPLRSGVATLSFFQFRHKTLALGEYYRVWWVPAGEPRR